MSPSRFAIAERTFDLVVALLLLILCAPLFGLVALGIWMDDGRPILFTQPRAGHNGTPFRIFKFRTLTTGPKDPTRPAQHTTRLGGPLRRWGIDELPQLWNVLRGEMSLVGPRPPLLHDLRQYSPRQQRRLQVRPGITGWAQIHGRNALPWPTRIAHDLWYVKNRSLLLDLYVLLYTPVLLISGTGTTGPDNRNPTLR